MATVSPMRFRIDAHDARKARRDLHHGFLIGAQHAVEGQRIGQRGAPGLGQRDAGGRELDVADADAVGAVLVLLDMVVRASPASSRSACVGRRRSWPAPACDSRTRRARRQAMATTIGRGCLHRALSRASANGLPTSPSMVATRDVEVLQRLLLAQARLGDARLGVEHFEQREAALAVALRDRIGGLPWTSGSRSRAAPRVRAASPAASRRRGRRPRSACCGWLRARPWSSRGSPARRGCCPGSGRTPGSAPKR